MIKINLCNLKTASKSIKTGGSTVTGLKFSTKIGSYLYAGDMSATFKLSNKYCFPDISKLNMIWGITFQILEELSNVL